MHRYGGINTLLGYISTNDGFSDFNYVQTIRTNIPIGNATSPYDDPQPADDNLPFYWTNNELPNYTNTWGYDVIFQDSPQRKINNGTWWNAELSVVGKNVHGN